MNESRPIKSYKTLHVYSAKVAPQRCHLVVFCLIKILAPHMVGDMVLTPSGTMQWQKAKPGKSERERETESLVLAGSRSFTRLVSPIHCSGLLPRRPQLGLRSAGTAPHTSPCLSCRPVARGTIPWSTWADTQEASG